MRFFKKTDVLIIIILIAAALAGYGIYQTVYQGKAAKAEIYYKSELIQTVDLNKKEDRTFSIPQNKNVIFHLYKDGSIRFEESDCPDKVCVHAGKLNTIGESAACLPNSIILKIVPADERDDDDPDLIVG